MLKDTDLVLVRNRNRGVTGYTLDGGFHRDFNYGETKKIPFGELKSLQYAPGGTEILEDCLVVEDKEALELLNMKVEPEYFYSEEDIKNILFAGSIDEFADFLNFAPEGAIEIAKDIAIKQEIPDVRKRDMLSEKTGLNINNAIMVNKVMQEEGEEEKKEAPKRRVPLENKEEAPKRRASLPEYKIVEKKK